MKVEPLPKTAVRRNLCVSLPPKSPQSISKAQAFQEGLFPLQCTPEPPPRTPQGPPPAGPSGIADPNRTFDLLEDEQTVCNDTIVMSTGTPGPSQGTGLHTGRAQEWTQVPIKR